MLLPNTKYINLKGALLGFLLCSFGFSNQAQVQHKQLRQEVLEVRKEEKNPISSKEKARPEPDNIHLDTKKLNELPPVAPIKTPYDQKNAKIIYLENADLISFDQITKPDVQTLTGNVKFRHDNATLSCDSAYFYKNTNSLDAYSNVKIVQGDTLFVHGNKLYYDGNTKLARLRGEVKMLNSNTTLTTDSLNYDRTTQLAYYFTGGKIVDPENILTSTWGEYSTKTENASFRDSVTLLNENFTMKSDSLKYNAKSHIVNLVGETHIRYQDETDIYTNNGWYNTDSERSMLLNRSVLVNQEGKSITGDTIFYDKSVKYGEIFGNAVIKDTIQKKTLYGDYIYYNEESELGIATDSALLVDWSDEKHLYIHADTLKTNKDSIYNEALAWHHVRIFREDVQGISDSLAYSSRDSVIHLLNNPVLWQEAQQFSSENIKIITKNQQVEEVHMLQNAQSIQHVEGGYYNQLSGKDIIAYLDSGKLHRVDVNGNAETIYFVRDDSDSTLIGVNRSESSFVNMHFKEKKIHRIVLRPSSSGVFYPIEMATDDIIYFPSFFWLEIQRPLKREDVFMRFAGSREMEQPTKNLPEGLESTLETQNSP